MRLNDLWYHMQSFAYAMWKQNNQHMLIKFLRKWKRRIFNSVICSIRNISWCIRGVWFVTFTPHNWIYSNYLVYLHTFALHYTIQTFSNHKSHYPTPFGLQNTKYGWKKEKINKNKNHLPCIVAEIVCIIYFYTYLFIYLIPIPMFICLSKK